LNLVDTRTKILGLDAASAAARRERDNGRRVRLVTGFFDPVLAAHARVLADAASDGAAVYVSLADPERPLLAGPARAELVAGLGVVAAVVVAEPAAAQAAIAPDDIIRQEAADARRTRELIEHVQSRQSGK
jgi:bifunctional ADP-heptose synthase (sugar kinase/adenylyltransferase)